MSSVPSDPNYHGLPPAGRGHSPSRSPSPKDRAISGVANRILRESGLFKQMQRALSDKSEPPSLEMLNRLTDEAMRGEEREQPSQSLDDPQIDQQREEASVKQILALREQISKNLQKVVEDCGIKDSRVPELIKNILADSPAFDMAKLDLQAVAITAIVAKYIDSPQLLALAKEKLIKEWRNQAQSNEAQSNAEIFGLCKILTHIFATDLPFQKELSDFLLGPVRKRQVPAPDLPSWLQKLHDEGIDLIHISPPIDSTLPQWQTILGKYSRSWQSIHLENRDDLGLWLKALIQSNPTALRRLDLSMCDELTDAAVKDIATHLKALQYLYLGGCRRLTNAAIKDIATHLKALQHLDLSGCDKLTDAAVKDIATNLTALRRLDLHGCRRLTDAAVKDIATNLTALLYLDLGWCTQLTDAAIKDIATHLKALQYLDLSLCYRLTDAAIKDIAAHLKALQHLNLRWCDQLTHAAVKDIVTHLTALQYLNLSGCDKLTDAEVKPLWDRGITVVRQTDSDRCRSQKYPLTPRSPPAS